MQVIRELRNGCRVDSTTAFTSSLLFSSFLSVSRLSEDTFPRTAHISLVGAAACALHTSACTRAQSAGLYSVLKTHFQEEKEVTSQQNLDCIHVHFQDTPTDTQHRMAHDHEVSLGSTTPLSNPSDTARSTFGCQAELPRPTCTTRTTLQTLTGPSPATRCKVQQPVLRQNLSQRLLAKSFCF